MAYAIRHSRYWLLAAGVAAALGFGGSQALASPRDAARESVCYPVKCDSYCRLTGQSGGVCFEGQCRCYIY